MKRYAVLKGFKENVWIIDAIMSKHNFSSEIPSPFDVLNKDYFIRASAGNYVKQGVIVTELSINVTYKDEKGHNRTATSTKINIDDLKEYEFQAVEILNIDGLADDKEMPFVSMIAFENPHGDDFFFPSFFFSKIINLQDKTASAIDLNKKENKEDEKLLGFSGKDIKPEQVSYLIDKNVHLSRTRHGNIYCMHQTNTRCGRWCPAFYEQTIVGGGISTKKLSICTGREFFLSSSDIEYY